MIEGSLEVEPPTILTDGKAEVGRVREEKERRERSEKRRSQEKEDAVREKVEKSRLAVFFPRFVAPEGRKVSSPKRRMRRHLIK